MTGTSLLRGEIATAPAAGRVDVIVRAFARDQALQEATYMPRPTAPTDPSPGDRCLLAFDDHGDAWVLAWEPA